MTSHKKISAQTSICAEIIILPRRGVLTHPASRLRRHLPTSHRCGVDVEVLQEDLRGTGTDSAVKRPRQCGSRGKSALPHEAG